MVALTRQLLGGRTGTAGLWAALALWATSADAQLRLQGEGSDILIQAPGHKVQVVGTTILDAGEKAAFDQFSTKAQYYGALYVDVTTGDFAYYMDSFHTLEAASIVAKAACESAAGAGSQCELYATVTPTADKVFESDVQTLSETSAREFLTSFLTLEKTTMFGAFAVSGLGDMAYFVLPDSAESVSERALQACAGFSAETLGNLPSAAQQAAVGASLETCRVIYLRYPRG